MSKKEISKAEAKVAAAEKKREKKPSNPKGNIFVRAGKATKKFFKETRSETKKIIWPDRTAVLKSTGVVLVAIAVCGLAIFGVDQLLALIISLLKRAAEKLASSPESAQTTVQAAAHIAGVGRVSLAADAARNFFFG